MVFSSLIFLWFFLPVVFVLHFFIQPKYANYLLVFASLLFYAWGEPQRVFLMAFSIIVNWGIGKGLITYRIRSRLILSAGIIFNLLLLGYYKYAGFGAKIINTLTRREILGIPETTLPIGISFFTFQAISYLIDRYREETAVQDSLANVALYISFFPQLIAGPIVKYKEMDQWIKSRTVTGSGIVEGFRLFIYGLSKKVLMSNVLGKSADIIYAMDVVTISGSMAWIASLFYTFQIYYDFSGYSDMAVGLGKMFGFEIPQNFCYPYLAKTAKEFWRKWHISLGSWFREYVYIPLGGSYMGGYALMLI